MVCLPNFNKRVKSYPVRGTHEMTLAAFQQAMSDMATDHNLAAAVRHKGTSALLNYTLSNFEADRLVDAASQAGMEITCSLARGNRLETLVASFPLTCILLQSDLRNLVDRFWAETRPDNYQLQGEDTRFATFLRQEFKMGRIQQRYAEDVFEYECASLDLALSIRHLGQWQNDDAAVREVTFRSDPAKIIHPLELGLLPPHDLEAKLFRVTIRLTADALEVSSLEVAPSEAAHTI
jgi:hypothetical protein